MPVYAEFRCGGCGAKAWGTTPLRKEFRSFSGLGYGFGRAVQANTVDDVTPPGWVAYDPYTYATYCPDCWASIESGTEDEAAGAKGAR